MGAGIEREPGQQRARTPRPAQLDLPARALNGQLAEHMNAQHGANRTSGVSDSFHASCDGRCDGRGAGSPHPIQHSRGDVMTTTTAIDQLKAAHRATWDSGDYTDVADRFVIPVGNAALEAAGIAPGTEVLDVAAGSGNPAIPAAQTGAR